VINLVRDIVLLSVLIAPALSIAGESCSNRNNQLAHLSGIQKAICERAIAAGYSMEEAGCENPNAAHYLDLDNSMSPARNKPGRAMATMYSSNGVSQGVQVCPGVYLATAHGVLDDLTRELRDGETRHKTPAEMGHVVAAYPLSPETRMTASTNQQFISPRINNKDAWNDPSTDYVFIKVDNPLPDRRNDFLPLVSATSEDLISYTEDNLIETYLYRNLPLFEKDSQGNYDFSRPTLGIDSLVEKLREPQRVNRECNFSSSAFSNKSTTNCPSEPGSSGSPMVTSINGRPYLSAMMRGGQTANIDRYQEGAGGSSLINSSAFCEDYQTACGSNFKCNSLRELLPEGEQSVSL